MAVLRELGLGGTTAWRVRRRAYMVPVARRWRGRRFFVRSRLSAWRSFGVIARKPAGSQPLRLCFMPTGTTGMTAGVFYVTRAPEAVCQEPEGSNRSVFDASPGVFVKLKLIKMPHLACGDTLAPKIVDIL